MAEPVSTTTVTRLAELVAQSPVTSAVHSQVDPAMVTGVVCGAFVWLIRTRESSRWHKAVYFAVSLGGGFYLSAWIVTRYDWLPPFVVGLGTAGSLVTIAVLVLDWVEVNVQPALDKLFSRLMAMLPGGKSNDDAS
ncbi:putative holin [Paraburkholderia sediminicola]|uniref:putative holin n=1 Tax=Paraburkholderia sediminicola TaxID=458836 RepID=UPI0038BB015D